MDANIHDESRDRRREEALARRLGEALDKATPSQTPLCPDAQAIAAYHEGSLDPEETEHCDEHFAACSRCRTILAVLVASDDTPLAEQEVARLGKLVGTTRLPRETPSQPLEPAHANPFDWRSRWLAPALGVAAVLAVWFAVKPPWRATGPNPPGTLIAQAPKVEPAPAAAPTLDRSSNAAPMNQQKPESLKSPLALRDRPASNTESSAPAARTMAKNRLGTGGSSGVPDAEIADNVTEVKKKEQTESPSLAVGGSAVPPQPVSPPAATPRLEAQSQAGPQPVPPQLAATADASNRSLPVPAPPYAPSEKSSNMNRATASVAGSFGASAAKTLKAPSGSVLWRIGARGQIERSSDAGRTFTTQSSPSQQDWLAGAPVSDTTCWIAGRNGALARTTNGEFWEAVASPAGMSGGSPDWIGVTASDAQTATITSSDQRRYLTRDGGKTWQAQ